ncbi:MAG: hypothetical protein N2C12_15475, partial [Planctomycetales bacterium]
MSNPSSQNCHGTSSPITLSNLADLIGGRLHGDGSTQITGAEILEVAGAGEITLADHPSRLIHLQDSPAAAVIIPSNVPHGTKSAIVVEGEAEEVQAAFTFVVTQFRPLRMVQRVGISDAAQISPTAQLQEDVDVHPGATIGEDVRIGRGSTIGSGVHV